MKSQVQSPWPQRAGLVASITLIAGCALWGGASRLDVPGLAALQPLAAICTLCLLLLPGPLNWSAVRSPLIFLGCLASLMVAQLVPLPPALWAALPGHQPFYNAAVVAGVEQVWRPISMTPDLTLASLVGLIVPFAILVAIARVSQQAMHWLVTAFVALLAMGCALGLLQIVGGGQSGFYLYRVTNPDSPVGFFANRNHQALLLAVGLPILIYWAVESSRSLRSSVRIPVAAAIGILMIVMLFVNGSRAGLGLGALGLILGLFIFRRSLFPGQGKGRWARPVAIVVLTLLPMVAVLASRDLALRRAAGTELSEELRLQVVPVVVRMMNDFMPIGSGFGSFDPVHRYYEPTALLRPTYLNHAHNDLLELLVTGGLPAALLLVAFTGWMVRRSITLFKANTAPARLGLSAMTGVLLILLGSLVDYPLRTPLMMASMALLCAWIEMSTVSGAWRRELGS